MQVKAPVLWKLDHPSDAHMRIVFELSMIGGIVMRTMWMATELLNNIYELSRELGIAPCLSENMFCISMGGKIVWPRDVSQPRPNYDHLRPINRAQ